MAIPPELKISANALTQDNNNTTLNRRSVDQSYFSRSSLTSMEHPGSQSMPSTPVVSKKTKSHGIGFFLTRKKPEKKEKEEVTVVQNPLKTKSNGVPTVRAEAKKIQSDGLVLGQVNLSYKIDDKSKRLSIPVATQSVTADASVTSNELQPSNTPTAPLTLDNLIAELNTYMQGVLQPETTFRDDGAFVKRFKQFIHEANGGMWIQTIGYGKKSQAMIEKLSYVYKKNAEDLAKNPSGDRTAAHMQIGKLMFNQIVAVMEESLQSSAKPKPNEIPAEVKTLLQHVHGEFKRLSPQADLIFLRMLCLRLISAVAIDGACEKLFKANKELKVAQEAHIATKQSYGEESKEAKATEKKLKEAEEKSNKYTPAALNGQKVVKLMQDYVNNHVKEFPKELSSLLS